MERTREPVAKPENARAPQRGAQPRESEQEAEQKGSTGHRHTAAATGSTPPPQAPTHRRVGHTLSGLLPATPASAPVIQAKAAGGGLPPALRTGIERLSGIAMDGVRVHYNSSVPAKLGAHAFTQGADIHVASGQERHLPHEAWHAVQQSQGRVRPTGQVAGRPLNDDKSLESEADRMGSRAASLGASAPSPSPEPAQRKTDPTAPVQRVEDPDLAPEPEDDARPTVREEVDVPTAAADFNGAFLRFRRLSTKLRLRSGIKFAQANSRLDLGQAGRIRADVDKALRQAEGGAPDPAGLVDTIQAGTARITEMADQLDAIVASLPPPKPATMAKKTGGLGGEDKTGTESTTATDPDAQAESALAKTTEGGEDEADLDEEDEKKPDGPTEEEREEADPRLKAFRAATVTVNNTLTQLWPAERLRILGWITKQEVAQRVEGGTRLEMQYMPQPADAPPRLRFFTTMDAPALAIHAMEVEGETPQDEKIYASDTNIDPLNRFAAQVHGALITQNPGIGDEIERPFDIAIKAGTDIRKLSGTRTKADPSRANAAKARGGLKDYGSLLPGKGGGS